MEEQNYNKIFNLDFNKSGTSSLANAMEILGIKSLHFKNDNTRLQDILNENRKKSKKLLHGIEEYQFFSDFEGSEFYKELDEQYPSSKFILTTRNLEDWLNSREKHVIRNQKKPWYAYDFLEVDRKKWTKEREKMEKEYKAYFKNRPNDILVIDICDGEGWEKLCPFLSKSIPYEDFPFLNKSVEQEKKLHKLLSTHTR